MDDMCAKPNLTIKRALKIDFANKVDYYIENQEDILVKGSFFKLFKEEFDLSKDEIDILNIKEVFVFKQMGKQPNEIKKDIWPETNSLTELWEKHKNNPNYIWNEQTRKIVNQL